MDNAGNPMLPGTLGGLRRRLTYLYCQFGGWAVCPSGWLTEALPLAIFSHGIASVELSLILAYY